MSVCLGLNYHSYRDVTMTVKDCKESGLRTAKLAVLLIKIMKYGIVLFYYINNKGKVQTMNLCQSFIVNN